MTENVASLPLQAPLIEIRPADEKASFRFKELYAYRELLGFLVWREITVRYKQTALGAGWALLQPLMNMAVFTIFFGRLAKLSSDGLPYSVFVIAALVPWQLFSSGLNQAANSLVNNNNLITKVYFPRLIIPLAAVLNGLADFTIGFLLALGICLYQGVRFTPNILFVPFLLLLLITTCFSVGLWLAALNVRYRDIRYTVPFLVQFWMFATPVVYSSNMLTGSWRLLYAINPMVGVIDGFRWAVLGAQQPLLYQELGISLVVVSVLLVTGLYYFRATEKYFADLI